MDDYWNLPSISPQKSIQIIMASTMSSAQKLLATSLIMESRVFHYHLNETKQDLLVLDVTHFLNHRINTQLISLIGAELAEKILPWKPELILTAPSSGNIPAIATASQLPHFTDVIYAPKGTPITMKDVYQAKSRSYTHGKSVDLTVAKDCLPEKTMVAICDDFLDTGRTGLDLASIVKQAGAYLACFFFVIEKPFGGREQLKHAGFLDKQIISLIKIDSMQPGKLKLEGFDMWFELQRKE